MDSLFRDEAVQAQRSQALGTVRLATPVSQQVWGICATVGTAAIVLWLWFGHYTRREHVTGTLVPQAGLITVIARGAGIVSRLGVEAGMHVQAGQALLTISGDQSSAALGYTYAAVAKSLQQQQIQVQATLTALPEQAAEQQEDLRRRIAMLGMQVGQINAQLALQHKEATSGIALLRKAQPLLKQGYVSTIEWDSYQTNALNAEVGVKQLQRQRLDTEQQRSQLEMQLQQLPLTTATTAHQLRGQLAQLAASVAQNDVARNTVLHASLAGTVASVLVKQGQTIEPGQSLMSILPERSPLEAQLLVPSSAIGFVHQGTSVVLHYQAFPY